MSEASITHKENVMQCTVPTTPSATPARTPLAIWVGGDCRCSGVIAGEITFGPTWVYGHEARPMPFLLEPYLRQQSF